MLAIWWKRSQNEVLARFFNQCIFSFLFLNQPYHFQERFVNQNTHPSVRFTKLDVKHFPTHNSNYRAIKSIVLFC